MEQHNQTFEAWLRFHFDRSTSPRWNWEWEEDLWGSDPALSVAYMTRAFEDAANVLQPFSDAQLDQGLWFLVSGTGSEGGMGALFTQHIDREEKQRCIRSICTLFEQCFAVRCTDSLSHRDEQASPLNSICYMWWDIFPAWGAPNKPALSFVDAELLAVMQKTLALDSVACQESALHGLGHWHLHYPNVTTAIIDAFLASRPKLSGPLHAYALAARKGAVQ